VLIYIGSPLSFTLLKCININAP